MKAKITRDGLLKIISENSVESYALGCWYGENFERSNMNIEFDWSCTANGD
jgi:hypothetical protein